MCRLICTLCLGRSVSRQLFSELNWLEFFIKSKPLHFWIFHWTPPARQISNEIPTLTSKNVFFSVWKEWRSWCVPFQPDPGMHEWWDLPCSALHSIRSPLFLQVFFFFLGKNMVGFSRRAGEICYYLHRQTDSRSWGPVTYSGSGRRLEWKKYSGAMVSLGVVT